MAEGNPNLLQVAQALRDELDAFLSGSAEAPGLRSTLEFVAQHMPVAENDLTSCKGKHLAGAKRCRGSIAVQEGQTTCEHSCAEHEEVMGPALWGALPKDLLHLVFARLPLAEISRLRCLSKEWKTSIETADSEFNRVCEATNCMNSFALISTDENQHGVFWVRVFDMKANRWHAFEFRTPRNQCCVLVAACGGGLVCLLSMAPEDEFSISVPIKQLYLTVWNLLTREKNELPPLYHLKGYCSTMVHLFVDPQTKHYKVMVANDMLYDSRILERAHVYDSESREWSKAEKSSFKLNVIFGMSYSWLQLDIPDIVSETWTNTYPCKYNFAEGRLQHLTRGDEPWRRPNVTRSYALMEDRLFVLDGFERVASGGPVYFILEYHADVNPGSAQSGSNWQFVRFHGCDPFGHAPLVECYYFHLFACKGFLLVCAQNEENIDSPYKFQRLWLYNLSTGKWRDLPNLIKDQLEICKYDVMCELRPWHILR